MYCILRFSGTFTITHRSYSTSTTCPFAVRQTPLIHSLLSWKQRAMSTPFLEKTPREVREIIYRYALSSPTGSVTLLETSELLGLSKFEKNMSAAPNFLMVSSSSNVNDVTSSLTILSLTLLRTCRQIYQECKDLFWKLNVLNLGEPMERSFSRLTRPYLLQPSGQLHSIELDLNKGTLGMIDEVHFTLEMLVHWSRVGSLKNIMINWDPRLPRKAVASGGGDVCRSLYSEHWFGFSVRNRVVIRTKPLKDQERTFQYNYLFEAFFPQLLHEVFGGELLMDGFLCFKDDQQLVKVFKAGREDEAIPVYEET